jgi:hypothetical protein
MLSSQQREAFSLAGSSDAPQPTTSRRHGHRLFNRRRKSETHAQSASMQSAAAVAAADSPVNGANASGSDRKRGIGRGLFVRRQHSPPLDAGTSQHYSNICNVPKSSFYKLECSHSHVRISSALLHAAGASLPIAHSAESHRCSSSNSSTAC